MFDSSQVAGQMVCRCASTGEESRTVAVEPKVKAEGGLCSAARAEQGRAAYWRPG